MKFFLFKAANKLFLSIDVNDFGDVRGYESHRLFLLSFCLCFLLGGFLKVRVLAVNLLSLDMDASNFGGVRGYDL